MHKMEGKHPFPLHNMGSKYYNCSTSYDLKSFSLVKGHTLTYNTMYMSKCVL